jgi:multidrug efflux pump subunit AcrB
MIRLFVGHPNAANVAMVVFLILGAVSVGSITRSTFPQLPLDTVRITVPYPGAAPAEVSDAICLRLEDAVEQIDQVEEFVCDARDNVAIMMVEGREGGNVDRLLADVRTELDALDDLPERSEPPIVELLGTTEPVVTIAVHGAMSYPVLKDYAEATRQRLQRLPGVSKVIVDGFTDRQLLIALDPRALQSLGLSAVDVAERVRALNLDVPAGDLTTDAGTVSLRVEDERTTVARLAELTFRAPRGGQEITLSDIAEIQDTFEYPNRRATFDGAPAALLRIEKTRSDDALDVMAEVRDFVDAQNRRESRVTLTLTQDLASLLDDRLGMLVKNGLQGLVLVMLVLYLFFSARHALWVGMGLPVAFAGAVFLMRTFGFQFDMMTLVALLIAIGIIVDDAIVVAENIVAQRESGKGAIDASVDGTLEVLPGVTASFLTTFVIFLPMAFLTGDIGRILAAVPVVLLMTLSVSLLEAFFILPAHLRHATIDGHRNRVQRWLDGHIEALRERAVVAVDRFVTWRYLALGSLLGVLLLCVSLIAGGIIGFTPLPELDNESIEARLLMPPGTPIAATEARVGALLAALGELDAEYTPEQPGDRPLVRHVTVRYGHNVDAHEEGDHVATIVVDLLDPEVRTLTSAEVRQLWRKRTGALSGVVFVKFTDPVIGPQGRPIEMRVVGDDPDTARQAAEELRAWMARYRGVHDLSLDLRPGKTEIEFTLKPGAQTLGVTSAALGEQLRAAFNGLIAQEIQVGQERFEVTVRFAEQARAQFNSLDTFMVRAAGGELVPLSAVATITEGRGYSRLQRVDGRPTVTLEGLVDFKVNTSAAVIGDTMSRFVPGWLTRHPDVELDAEGETDQANQTLGSLRQGFVLGFIGMYLLLALQFRSYLEPLVVVAIIPLSLIGVVLGHVLLGYNLTMPSMLGFVSLAGIVVNDSILLVTFVEKRLGEGLELHDAVVQASHDRFRAILLTSLTTVMGLLPLLLETSMQAKVVIPLAISLAFGLTTATALVLFVIPAFYMVLHDFGAFHRHDELTPDTDAPAS